MANHLHFTSSPLNFKICKLLDAFILAGCITICCAAKYLEEVLREGFSYPWVNGIVLWTALHPNQSCYQMCLTDDDFQNLSDGEVVGRLLDEWETKETSGETDEHGMFSFAGFLGSYEVAVNYENRSMETTLSLNKRAETRHFNIQL